MFLLANVVKNLFLAHMAKATRKPLADLEVRAKMAHAVLKGFGEPKTPMDVVKYMSLKAAADAADEAYLKAAERADQWGEKREKPTRFVSSYVSGKLDAVTAGVVVYPYVPAVIEWVKGVIG